mgnify:CR=1 FL=1
MNNRNLRILFSIMIVTLILLSIFGYTYAYFTLQIDGTGKDIVVSTGDLKLEYVDGKDLTLSDALPGDSVSKTITVKNVGSREATYALYWDNLINTIDNFELHVSLECKSYKNYGTSDQEESGTCNNIYRAVPISSTTTTNNIKNGILIDIGITHEYTIVVKFDNKNYPQNDNKNKTFSGKISIKSAEVYDLNCTFDGDMVQGAEYVNGQYTYRYMQEYNSGVTPMTNSISPLMNVVSYDWQNITTDGWGVILTDKESTSSVNSKVCTSINNKPIVSMSYMFMDSQATSIDLSSFNTENIINMEGMFFDSQSKSLDFSNFNTSSVTNMENMFMRSQVGKLDLSSFDTTNVINMYSMFSGSQATSIDLSSFNIKNVTNVSEMFYNSLATVLDLSSFSNNKATSLYWTFYGIQAKYLDISNFDTSNVTDMIGVFNGSAITDIIGLNNFNTSNVTNMSFMFNGSQTEILDLSSFDTSKVIDMSYMFARSNIKTIYVSDKFTTDNVGESNNMFFSSTNLIGGAGTVYDSTKTDATYAKIDGGTSSPGYFTLKS